MIPEGYDHKATSHNFNQTEKVSIYYNKVANDYLLEIGDGSEDQGWFFTKEQLELIVHAASDVLHDAKV